MRRPLVHTLALLALLAAAIGAWAYWSAPGAGSASAASGSFMPATISVSALGSNAVTVTWSQQASLVPTPLGDGTITYAVQRRLDSGSWAALLDGGCTADKPHGTTSCVDAPPASGSYSYRVVASHASWTATSNVPAPVAVTLDTIAPATAITLSGVSGGAFKDAATVYYRGAAAGSFTLTNAVSDSGSGPASSATAALTGTSTGWSHSPSTVSSPAGGPYVSNAFSWSASTTSGPGETVTGSDGADNTTQTALTFTADDVGPAGGAVDATGLVGFAGRYSTSTSLSVGFSAGTDSGSGMATSGAQLRRSTAPLESTANGNGICMVPYSDSVLVESDPVSPVTDVLPDQACYRYEYVVFDRVGNKTIYTGLNIKMDTTAPTAPTLAYSGLSNVYRNASTLYYRSNASSGAFTVTAAAADAASGIASYAFPTLPAGWTATAGVRGVNTYSWGAANPTAPSGAQNVTATNNATLTSPATGFTMISDITAPATGSVSYTDGAYASPSVAVSFTPGSDVGGSGVDAASGLLHRASGTLTGSTCSAWTGFTPLAAGGNPSSPFTDSTVLEGRCYQYRYLISDNVGNQATYTNANVAKITPRSYLQTVTTTGGLVNHWRLGQAYVPVATDTFGGTSGALLTSRVGELGATWTNWGGPYGVPTTLVFSNQGRVRKSGTTFNYYHASASPASANYAVEADVHVKSLVTGDRAGVVGRWQVDPTGTGGTEDWFEASYNRTTATSGTWQLRESANQALGTATTSTAQNLVAGQTYRLRLELIGTSIKLYVDGALMVTVVDATPTITLTGKPGVFSGNSGVASTVTDTTGMHLDNFRVVPTSAATVTDSKGTATGTHTNGVTLGAAGALAGDADTAMSFDGVDDHVTAPRQVQDDLSLEFWFKSTQGIGTAAAWTAGAGMVDASIAGTTNNDFGVSLRSDGKVVAGVGNPDTSVASTSSGFNNGQWHHVVFTRVKATGAFALYVDGNPEGSTSSTNVAALTGQATINFGRLASATNYFAGSLDEVATYNVALSAATAAAHYQAGITP